MSELLTQQERTDLVAYHEREVARLQGEVSGGNWNAFPEYAYALAKRQAAELGVDLPAPVNPLQAKLDRLVSAAEKAVPFLYDHVAMTLGDGPGDRIALDNLEEAIKQAKL